MHRILINLSLLVALPALAELGVSRKTVVVEGTNVAACPANRWRP